MPLTYNVKEKTHAHHVLSTQSTIDRFEFSSPIYDCPCLLYCDQESVQERQENVGDVGNNQHLGLRQGTLGKRAQPKLTLIHLFQQKMTLVTCFSLKLKSRNDLRCFLSCHIFSVRGYDWPWHCRSAALCWRSQNPLWWKIPPGQLPCG